MEIPIATSPYAGAGEDFRSGSDASAQVTIVEFSDFECPACETMSSLLHQLREEFPADKVRLVFRNFPLDQSCNPAIRRPMHMNACKVAYLARCAGQNQKFWQFHDAAFKYHAEAATQAETWALALGLTQDEIAACLNSESIKNKVKDDMAWAEKLGVDSTPTLFINNRKFIGPREALSGLIRALLEQ
jgi:protein-disulfide isomerase